MHAEWGERWVCVEQAHGDQINEVSQVRRDTQDQAIYTASYPTASPPWVDSELISAIINMPDKILYVARRGGKMKTFLRKIKTALPILILLLGISACLSDTGPSRLEFNSSNEFKSNCTKQFVCSWKAYFTTGDKPFPRFFPVRFRNSTLCPHFWVC